MNLKHQSSQAKPNGAKPDQVELNLIIPKQAKRDEAKLVQNKPSIATPVQIGLSQIKPNRIRPNKITGQAKPNRTEPKQANVNQTGRIEHQVRSEPN